MLCVHNGRPLKAIAFIRRPDARRFICLVTEPWHGICIKEVLLKKKNERRKEREKERKEGRKMVEYLVCLTNIFVSSR